MIRLTIKNNKNETQEVIEDNIILMVRKMMNLLNKEDGVKAIITDDENYLIIDDDADEPQAIRTIPSSELEDIDEEEIIEFLEKIADIVKTHILYWAEGLGVGLVNIYTIKIEQLV